MSAASSRPATLVPPTAEHRRLFGLAGAEGAVAGSGTGAPASAESGWRKWGPYLADRAWGTVREDYSPDGTAWEYFPHDHARSRAYRWNEDGLGGLSDDHGFLCFGWAFWNGVDPILKERLFGLTGNEGNHGEDDKELWWYLDSTPTYSWMKWRYVYPQRPFPYNELVNHGRSRSDPEYELLDTGLLDDDRYWDIHVEYAKATADDILIRLTVRNAGPERASLHVLPSLWWRNTWSWGLDERKAQITADGLDADRLRAGGHTYVGAMQLVSEVAAPLLFCDNETNTARLWGAPGPAHPKDAINDHVVSGGHRGAVSPVPRGTKAAFWHVLEIDGGAETVLRLRLSRDGAVVDTGFDNVIDVRRAEADDFYSVVIPEDVVAEERLIARRAFAGMLWGKKFFNFDVERWLDGDPAQPAPPAGRAMGRNADWRHLNNADVISMPDPWEYPWYAAWDLAFHCVVLARVDPDFAKEQLLLMCREWYMHPNGQLPAYEWAFGDVNPPVHAWAALRVFESDGGWDYHFLERIIHKLSINFTWWVNRKDEDGNNVFSGGFLGLDNIGPIDRSRTLTSGHLEQSDGTAWMAMYCLNLLHMCLVMARHDDTYEDLATKFFEHFAYIAQATDRQGLWHEDDGFYYDVLHLWDGPRTPLRIRSMVGLIPVCAAMTLDDATVADLPDFFDHFEWFVRNKPQYADKIDQTNEINGQQGRLLAIVDPLRLRRILKVVLDEREFLSPYGLRSLAASHREVPFTVHIDGLEATVGYEPGESTTGLFGGNSNWRGPVWFPINFLAIEALHRYAEYLGDNELFECPTGSGVFMSLRAVADELSRRLVALFLRDEQGRRPVFGRFEKLQYDPSFSDSLLFFEYFHGDTGAGLGASHQTGWTGLVAELIVQRPGR